MVVGHFQVALPWRLGPPYFPYNKVVAEWRGLLLKKERLLRNEVLFEKGFQKEELEVKDRSIWYLPHNPVTHPKARQSESCV